MLQLELYRRGAGYRVLVNGVLRQRTFNRPLAIRAAILLFSSTPRMAAKALSVKTGLLIHGCHLGAKGWHHIMWGDVKRQRLGRLPHAMRLAWEEKAEVVVIGSGASEKDGVIEGRYAVEYLAKNWERLQEFRVFANMNLDEVRRHTEPLLITDVRSKSTREELQAARSFFMKEGCTRVILVSSPTHISRCVRDACSVWDEGLSTGASVMGQRAWGRDDEPAELGGTSPPCQGGVPEAEETTNDNGPGACDAHKTDDNWRPIILASPCETSFTDYAPDDVAIIEPPHRGDDPVLTAMGLQLDGEPLEEAYPEGLPSRPPLLHELAGQMIRLPKGEKSARFRRELNALLHRYSQDNTE